jgi:hypothetical protein
VIFLKGWFSAADFVSCIYKVFGAVELQSGEVGRSEQAVSLQGQVVG